MTNINQLRPRTFSDLDIALGQVTPALNVAQMETLRGIAGRLDASTPCGNRGFWSPT